MIIIFWSDGLYSQTALGDNQVKVDILQSSIGGDYTLQPTRSFRDVLGTYSMQSAGVDMTLPVHETPVGETYDKGLSMILLRANASTIDPAISVLAQQHKLYASSVGLTYGTFTSSRNEYALTMNAGIAEDEVTIHDARARFTGFGLGTSHMDENTILIYGLAYTYTFDQAGCYRFWV